MNLDVVKISVDSERQSYVVRYLTATCGPVFLLVPQKSCDIISPELDVVTVGAYEPLSVDYSALGPNAGVYRVRGRFLGEGGFVFSADILNRGTK